MYKSCTDKNARSSTHCFFCASSENLQIGCFKKRNNNNNNNNKKQTETSCFSG